MTKALLRSLLAVLLLSPMARMLLLSLSLVSCAHNPSADAPPKGPSEQNRGNDIAERNLYQQGLSALAKKDYVSAEKYLSKLLADFPTTRWLEAAYFNLGLSLENQNRYLEAVNKYKTVVDLDASQPSRNSTEALYRLSLCYEALNDDPKTVLTLLELQKQNDFLDSEIANAEVPARLAAAYARQGNHEQAGRLFAKAEDYIKRLRRVHLSGDRTIWLPKTLFSMGHVPPLRPGTTSEEFTNYMRSFGQSQLWLVDAARTGDNPWAKQAASEIVSRYEGAWTNLVNHRRSGEEDLFLVEKIKQDEKRSMAAALFACARRLVEERLPSTDTEPELVSVTEIYKTADGIGRKANAILEERDMQDQPTSEAKHREGLKRRGKMVSPQ